MDERYLYRAKQKETREWIEGLPSYGPKREINSIEIALEDAAGKITEGLFEYIDPETICQCTGMRDKNKNPIWEGDIVSYPDYELCQSGDTDQIVNVGLVAWDEDTMSFYFTNRNVIDMDDIDISAEAEVIGNRFDNPELLEG